MVLTTGVWGSRTERMEWLEGLRGLIEENPMYLPVLRPCEVLHASHVTTLPVSEAVDEEAAQLRARHGFRTPDAILLATATHSGASSFLTNDSRLARLPSLNFLAVDQLNASEH